MTKADDSTEIFAKPPPPPSPTEVQTQCLAGQVPGACTAILVRLAEGQDAILRTLAKRDKAGAVESTETENEIEVIKGRVSFLEMVAHSLIALILLGALAFIGRLAVWVWVKVWS